MSELTQRHESVDGDPANCRLLVSDGATADGVSDLAAAIQLDEGSGSSAVLRRRSLRLLASECDVSGSYATAWAAPRRSRCNSSPSEARYSPT